MNTVKLVVKLALGLAIVGLAACAPGGPASTSFPKATAITIPAAGTGPGVSDPYPSTVNVTGMTGTISKVTVTLREFSHTWPGDVAVLLVGPGGQSVEIMSDSGGATDVTGVTFILDSAASASIPSPIVAGTYQPSGSGETYPAPAPAGPHGTSLTDFNGTSPNGVWELYVYDDAGGDAGSFAGGWTLNIVSN